MFSIRRIVPETQAAERRTWNSKPSEEMSVTKGDGVVMVEVEVEAESTSAVYRTVIVMYERRACKSTSFYSHITLVARWVQLLLQVC